MTIDSVVNSEIFLKINYLLSITTETNRYVFDNKNFRYNQELAKTILINVKNIIENKTAKLNYQVIGDWQEMTARFLEIELSNRQMLGDEASLNRVIKANNLEVVWDLNIIKNLVKEIFKLSYKGSFAIKLFAKNLQDSKDMKKIITQLEKTKLSANRFLLVFDMDEIVKLDDLSVLEFLKDKNFVLGLENAVKYISIENIEKLELFDYLFVDNFDVNDVNYDKFTGLLDDKVTIYNHKHETLKKSMLTTKKIELVKGTMFPRYNNLKDIKK